jgi:hypothetical protein
MARVGTARFHRTIEAADLEGVRRLLAEGAPLERHLRGLTALHVVVLEGTEARRKESRPALFSIAQALLDAGADIDAATREPKTSALQLAMPDEEWVAWLLARGANPNIFDSSERDKNTVPPLTSAILRGSTSLLRQLLAAGAKTDFVCGPSSGSGNLLVIALNERQVEVFDLLLTAARWTPQQLNEALARALRLSDYHAALKYHAIASLVGAGARGDARTGRFDSSVVFTAYTSQDRRAIELLRPATAPEVMRQLDAWVADRTGKLGVIGFDSPAEEEAERKALALPPGAVVKTLVPDGAAERAGIRPRDLILTVAGREVRSFAEIRPALVGFKAGQSVDIEIVSEGQARMVSAVLRSPSGWD